MNCQFNNLIVAGTFDRLHNGHLQLINTAVNLGRQVFCGLTTEQLNKNKVLHQTIQKYQQRKKELKNYLQWINADKKTAINPISDIYGPTLREKNIDAIITTLDSANNVDKINRLRVLKKLKPVKKIIVNLLTAEDKKRLSSTRIRLGQINRKGKVFDFLFKKKILVLPKNQRHYFKKPLGKLLKISSGSLYWLPLLAKKEIQKQPAPMVITVGDIVTQSFISCQVPFSLSVIDFKSRRQNLPLNYHHKFNLLKALIINENNQPGTISFNLIKSLEKLTHKAIFNQKLGILKINGEEDLTVLPSVLIAPLESLIFYGQPDKGIVQLRVTEKIKEKVYRLLEKFI
jgi:cytidyltransferase-like protein